MKLLRKLFPTAYYKNVFDIPLDTLRQKGVKGLVFDIDNTLSPYDCPEPCDEVLAFIKRAVDMGFAVCLLSNNSARRVELYNKKLCVNAVSRANKPLRRGLLRAMSLIGTTPEGTVLIGDQIFTDVWCGNRANVRTILVAPRTERDEWITKVKRGVEKVVIKEYYKYRSADKNAKRRQQH